MREPFRKENLPGVAKATSWWFNVRGKGLDFVVRVYAKWQIGGWMWTEAHLKEGWIGEDCTMGCQTEVIRKRVIQKTRRFTMGWLCLLPHGVDVALLGVTAPQWIFERANDDSYADQIDALFVRCPAFIWLPPWKCIRSRKEEKWRIRWQKIIHRVGWRSLFRIDLSLIPIDTLFLSNYETSVSDGDASFGVSRGALSHHFAHWRRNLHREDARSAGVVSREVQDKGKTRIVESKTHCDTIHHLMPNSKRVIIFRFILSHITRLLSALLTFHPFHIFFSFQRCFYQNEQHGQPLLRSLTFVSFSAVSPVSFSLSPLPNPWHFLFPFELGHFLSFCSFPLALRSSANRLLFFFCLLWAFSLVLAFDFFPEGTTFSDLFFIVPMFPFFSSIWRTTSAYETTSLCPTFFFLIFTTSLFFPCRTVGFFGFILITFCPMHFLLLCFNCLLRILSLFLESPDVGQHLYPIPWEPGERALSWTPRQTPFSVVPFFIAPLSFPATQSSLRTLIPPNGKKTKKCPLALFFESKERTLSLLSFPHTSCHKSSVL